ncbi:MAG: hypothetical protein LBS21_02390, partial [Clostridiales bacterium]|nr:hypothetical protein [Clostridiales bacterium]
MKGDICYNQSGYYDPTAGQALENIIKAEAKAKPAANKRKRRKRKPKKKAAQGIALSQQTER